MRLKYILTEDNFQITNNKNNKTLKLSATEVLFSVNEFLCNHGNEIGLKEENLKVAIIKRIPIEEQE